MGMNRVRAVLERFLEHVGEIDRVLHLCMGGLGHVERMPGVFEALEKAYDLAPSLGLNLGDRPTTSLTEKARERAKFATSEIERGFPTLHAHAVVAAWGALDSLIPDLVIAHLREHPQLMDGDAFTKIRIPIVEFQRLRGDDRLRLLVKEAGRSANADLKSGILRFELLLGTVNLSGPVEDGVRATLFEMCEVRNVLVHRAGIADRRYRERCPNRKVKRGEQILLNHKDYTRYMAALHAYALELINRFRVAEGLGRYEKPQEPIVSPPTEDAEPAEGKDPCLLVARAQKEGRVKRKEGTK